MDSVRQQKFSKLIQKELGEIFQQDAKNLFGNAFITVTNVNVSPDLSVAKVHLSFMLAKNKKAMLNEITLMKKDVRKMLGQRIGKQVRIVPDLVFLHDEGADHAAKIDEIINNLNIPPAEDEDDGKS